MVICRCNLNCQLRKRIALDNCRFYSIEDIFIANARPLGCTAHMDDIMDSLKYENGHRVFEKKDYGEW